MKNKLELTKETSEQLDAIRGFSAIIVFIAHYNQIFNLPVKGLNGFYHLFFGIVARYGVIIFFLLSGFLITASIINNIVKNDSFQSSVFFKNRFTRIYPAYIFSILLCIIIYNVANYLQLHGSDSFRTVSDLYVAREKFILEPKTYYNSIFFLNNFIQGFPVAINMNGPLWTISYEWWLYMIAMFYTIWYKNKKILTGLIPLAIIIGYLFYTSNYGFIWFSSFWFIGSISCILYYYDFKPSNRLIFTFTFILSLIAIIYIYKDWKILIPADENSNFLFQFLIAVLLILIFNLSFINWRAFTKIFKKSAKYSYTLYVVHFPILLLLFSFLHTSYQEGSIIIKFFIFTSIFLLMLVFSRFLSGFLENTSFYKNMMGFSFKKKE